MSSDSPVVIEGRFWLPTDRHRSYGRIDYDAEHGIRLHLVDTNLTQWDDGSGPRGPGPVEVLLGESLGGQPLTVLGFYTTKWTYHGLGPGGGDVLDGFAQRVLRGIHARSDNDLAAPSVTCSLYGLREFLVGGEVDGGPLPRPTDPHRAEMLSVDIAEGITLLLSAARQEHFNLEQESSEVRANAQWNLDPPLPLPRLERDYIRPLQDLILFATRRQSYVTGLTAHFKTGQPLMVEVLQQPYPPPRDAASVYALTLNLRDHHDPPALLAAWFTLRRKVGPVWEQFFAVLDRPESLLEDRLLGLMAFAEGYHRALHDQPPLSADDDKSAKKAVKSALKDKRVRGIYTVALGHANSQTLRERLDYLSARALGVLGDWWDLDAELFCAELSDTRNWLIHWGKRGKHVVEESQGMVDLVRRLIVVMYVNVLLDLGLDGEATAKVIGSGWRLEGLP
jgi:hypothetical protein